MTTPARLTLLAGMGLAALAAIPLVAPSGAAVGDPEPRLHRVRVADVVSAPATRTIRLHGQTRARARSVAAFTSAGRVVARSARVGDAVEAGDVLARLDPLPLAHAVRAARAQVDDLQARRSQVVADRDRLRQLAARGAVAPAELERIESQESSLDAAIAQARAGLAEAERQEREGVLRAPYPARVAAVFAEPGDTVAAGAPVVALVGDQVEVVIEAPESVWALVGPDVPASVVLSGQGCTLHGARVDRMAAAPASPGSLFEVHVALPAAVACRVGPGLAAVVDLRLPVAPAVSVPVRAVVDPTGSGASVLRVREARVERVAVTPGRLVDDRLTVTGGLVVGDRVVVAGLTGLVAGDTVEVMP